MRMPDISGDDLPTLRKRFRALFTLLHSKEAHIMHLHQVRTALSRELADLRASVDPGLLASERAANAMLTEENERLQRELEAARAEQPCCEGGPQWGHAWNCKELP